MSHTSKAISALSLIKQRDGRLSAAAGWLDYMDPRLLICEMTDWQGYVKEMAELLRPGAGWLEVHDYAEVWF